MRAGSERKERSAVVLRANGGFALPKVDGTPVDERVFTATYYDTPHRRLSRAGIRLRRRLENGNNVWELHLPRSPEARTIDVEGGPAGPPPGLARLLSGLIREDPLEEVQTVRTRRKGLRVKDNDIEMVEVLVDSKAVLDGGRVEREFTEIALRPLDSDTRPLRSLSKRLESAGARPFDDPARQNGTARKGTLASALAEQHARLLAHDPAVRLADDPEDVHQLRVATRRLRAVLRAARPFLTDDRGELVRSELSWLAGLLGSVRDLDVLIESLRKDRTGLELPAQAGVAHLVDHLVAERETARGRLLRALRTKRYLRLLAQIEELAESPPLRDKDVPARKLASKEFKKLRSATATLDRGATDAELHKVRIRVKRARYAAELAEIAVGKPAKRFVRDAKLLQDVAGDLQDAVVAEEHLRTLVEQIDRPEAAYAAGRLVERAAARRAVARRGLPDAWRKLEKSGRQAWA